MNDLANTRPMHLSGMWHDHLLITLPGRTSTWVRSFLLVGAITAIFVTFRDLERHTDSLTAVANALALVCLAVAIAALLSNRRLGLTGAIILTVVVLGVLRSIASIWGVPTGWSVTQSINVTNRTAVSESHMPDLSFSVGDVPAHLINDTRRFNFRGTEDDEPKRVGLPVSMVARGYVIGNGDLVVTSSSPIRISVGSEVTDLRPPIVGYHRAIAVSREEPVSITFSPTGVDTAALRVGPAGIAIFSQPTSGTGMTVRRLLGQAASILDLMTVAASLLILSVWMRIPLRTISRQSITIPVLVAMVIFLTATPDLVTWLSRHNSLVVLSGGSDWLTYESFARDIRDNSLLMLQGRALGTASAFYYQPLYPYVLAFLHLLVGESVQGIILMQLLGVSVVIVLAFWALPRNLKVVMAFAVIGLGSGIFREWMLMAERLLSENLLIVILAVLLFVISRLRAIPTVRSMLLVGVLLGIAVLARSTSWLAIPFILFTLLRATPRHGLRLRLVAVVVPIVVLAALIPTRNLVAARNPALLPTSGSINLFIGNVPAGRKITSEPWITLSKTHDPRLVAVAEAVVNVPDQVARKIVDKLVYVLGFPRSMDADNPVLFWPVLSLWLVAPLGFLLREHSRLAWTAIVLAVAHAASLVVFFPNNYYYRLEMPATLPLALWDSFAIAGIVNGGSRVTWLGRYARKFLKT